MKWNRTTDYAIRAMVCLAAEERIISSNELSKMLGIPRQAVIENTAPLHNVRLLDSKAGTNGGYSLAKAAPEISMYDIFSAIEEPTLFPVREGAKAEILDHAYCFLQLSLEVLLQETNLAVLDNDDLAKIENTKKVALNRVISSLVKSFSTPKDYIGIATWSSSTQ